MGGGRLKNSFSFISIEIVNLENLASCEYQDARNALNNDLK